jgi:hypothetical protein
MSIAGRIPILGLVAGIAVVIVGFNQGNTALIIIGFVLIILGVFRYFRK